MKRIWTEAEEKLLAEKYPRYGTCCLEHFPGKTKRQLIRKAEYMGLCMSKPKDNYRASKRRTNRFNDSRKHFSDLNEQSGDYFYNTVGD